MSGAIGITLTYRGPSLIIRAYGYVFTIGFGKEVVQATAESIIRDLAER